MFGGNFHAFPVLGSDVQIVIAGAGTFPSEAVYVDILTNTPSSRYSIREGIPKKERKEIKRMRMNKTFKNISNFRNIFKNFSCP